MNQPTTNTTAQEWLRREAERVTGIPAHRVRVKLSEILNGMLHDVWQGQPVGDPVLMSVARVDWPAEQISEEANRWLRQVWVIPAEGEPRRW
jgi:hypothetical protein